MGGQPIVGLAVQPPSQPQGPLQMAEGALSVQAMIAQDRLRRQAEQQNQVTLQQQQLQLQQQQEQEQAAQLEQKDAMSFRRAYQEANGSWSGAIEKAKAAGVGPQFIAKAEAANLDHITKLASLTKDQLDNAGKHNELIGQAAQAVLDAPDDQKDQIYHQNRNNLIAHGVASEDEIPAQRPNDDALSGMVSNGLHLKDNLENARKIQELNQKLPAEQAKATVDQLGLIGQVLGNAQDQTSWTAGMESLKKSGVPPHLLAPYKPTFTQEQAAMAQKMGLAPSAVANAPVERQELAEFLKHPKKGYEATPLGFMQYKASIAPAIQNFYATGGSLGVPGSNASNPAPAPAPAPAPGKAPAAAPGPVAAGTPTVEGKPLSQYSINNVPPQIRNQVQMVLDYRGKMPPANSRAAVPQAVRQWVSQLDPNFDETTYSNRQDTLKEFQKDMSTGQLGAVNTALGHLGELYTAAQALNQNDLPLLHNIASRVGAATGGDAATVYQAILHRVGPEMTAAYVKGGGTEGERGANETDFDVQKGQKQIISNIAESAQLLKSKIASKKKAWETGFKPYRDQDQFDSRFLTDDSKATLDALSKLAPTNKGAAVTIPPGAKTATGPNGHKIFQQGNQWIDSVTGKPL